jgi:hypothetical protein
MASDTDRHGQCSRIHRIIVPALALSGALALAGCAIQRGSDLGPTSECGDFNPATRGASISPFSMSPHRGGWIMSFRDDWTTPARRIATTSPPSNPSISSTTEIATMRGLRRSQE